MIKTFVTTAIAAAVSVTAIADEPSASGEREIEMRRVIVIERDDEPREVQQIEIEKEIASDTSDSSVTLDLDINGEEFVIELDSADFSDPEVLEEVYSQLPESLQETVRVELFDISRHIDAGEIYFESPSTAHGDEQHNVWVMAEEDGGRADVIVRLIENSELSDNDIARIMTALESKL